MPRSSRPLAHVSARERQTPCPVLLSRGSLATSAPRKQTKPKKKQKPSRTRIALIPTYMREEVHAKGNALFLVRFRSGCILPRQDQRTATTQDQLGLRNTRSLAPLVTVVHVIIG